MGVAWGIANIAASPIGMLADRIGLELTLSLVALAPLAAACVFGASTVRSLFSRRKPDEEPAQDQEGEAGEEERREEQE